MAIPMPRRGMDAWLFAGNPGFHGVRGAWTSTVRRSRSGARDHQNPICRLLVRGGGAPDCAVKRNVAASATLDGVRNRSDAIPRGTSVGSPEGEILRFEPAF